jgi:hypothetical protein
VLEQFAGSLSASTDLSVDEPTRADPEWGCARLSEASFAEVRVETRPLTGAYRTPAAALEWALAWPLTGAVLDTLEREARVRFRTAALAALERPGDLTWEYAVNYYTARRD